MQKISIEDLRTGDKIIFTENDDSLEGNIIWELLSPPQSLPRGSYELYVRPHDRVPGKADITFQFDRARKFFLVERKSND